MNNVLHLENSTTSLGERNRFESCILSEIEQPYSSGQFVWSGFDFIGEPTPYHTRNSYFGQVDTAGFPKDSYYLYQAAWTDIRKIRWCTFPVLDLMRSANRCESMFKCSYRRTVF